MTVFPVPNTLLDMGVDPAEMDIKPARPGTASSAMSQAPGEPTFPSTAPVLTASVPSAVGPAPRKARSGSTSAAVLGRKANPEKRANHNAIERARRESLNSRFLILAASLPAISEIRRPSKSLIVNRSLQFVADSLSREVLYRDIVKDLHARNRQLLEQLNEARARAGQHDQIEQLPPLEPNLPKPLTEVAKDRPSSRPKNGISTGTLPPGTAAINSSLAAAAAAAAAAVAAVNADGAANDLDELDDDDCFPLPAGGLDGLSISLGATSSSGPMSPTYDAASNSGSSEHSMEALHHAHAHSLAQHHQQYLQGIATAGFFAPPTVTAAPTGSSTGTGAGTAPASPPELSSGASSGSSPISSVSSSHGTPAMYDMAQPYPVMSAAALAAANVHAAQQHEQQAQAHAHGHVRAATAPTGSSASGSASAAVAASVAQHMASIYAQAQAAQNQQQQHPHAHAHSLPHVLPEIHPHHLHAQPHAAANLSLVTAYLQEQQHQLQQQQQQQHPENSQQQQTYAALAAAFAAVQQHPHAHQQPHTINNNPAAAHHPFLSASAPHPSSFIPTPVNGFVV